MTTGNYWTIILLIFLILCVTSLQADISELNEEIKNLRTELAVQDKLIQNLEARADYTGLKVAIMNAKFNLFTKDWYVLASSIERAPIELELKE